MTVVADLARRHRPTLGSFPGAGVVERRLRTHAWPARPLAGAPPGSGLVAVPGDAGLPVVGHTFEMLRSGPDYMMQRYREYGPVSWAHSLGTTIVAAVGPDATQAVLANKDKAFSQTGWEYFIGPFFRRGLMLLDFAEHHQHRRIMQEAFTRDRLAGYLASMDALIADRVTHWAPGPLRFYDVMRRLSLDVATVVFMARDDATDSRRLTGAFNDMVHAGTAVLRFPVPGLRWSAGLRGRRLMEAYFRSTMPAKRASDGADLFAALCHAETDDGRRFDDDDVVNHMIFLMMAAHDTSTTTTCAMAYYLAAYPEWQERARAQSDALGDGPVDLDAIGTLTTLDLVMNESLRLVAPVPQVVRRTVRDTELLGHHVPAGTITAVSPWLNHYLPEYWTNPERFDPERFADGRREDKSHRYAFLPFGGGAHKCIGMHFGGLEVKTVLHRLLRRYRFEVAPSYRVHWDTTALPFPSDGLPITLRGL